MSLILEEYRDSICILTINREERRNSMNIDLLKALQASLNKVETNNDVHVVIIRGSGEKVFASGADLKEASTLTKEDRKVQIGLGHEVFLQIENLRAPVIAALNGHTLGGGCELALACDIRILDERAKIGLVEVGIGTIPGWGGTQRLPKIVGLGIAKEMIFTGAALSSDEALAVGLVNRIAEKGKSLEVAIETANRICKNGPYAVQMTKTLVNQSSVNDLKLGIELEKKCSDLIFDSYDRTEGIKAFLEKRKPQFKGK